MRPMLRRAPVRGAALLLLCLTGCGGAAVAPPDQDAARAALTAALESWKAGGKVEALQGQTPPITMRDEAWEAGAKLVSYKIRDNGRPFGANLHCTVELTLAGRDAGRGPAVVTYIVGTNPVITIFRE